MNRNAMSRTAAVVAGPLALLVVPKCPLCLLPLLAASGVAVAPGPALNALVATVVVAWLVFLLRGTRSLPLRGIALVAGALVIAGRVAGAAAVSWAGVALMVAIAVLRLFSRQRVCASACPTTSPTRKVTNGHSTGTDPGITQA